MSQRLVSQSSRGTRAPEHTPPWRSPVRVGLPLIVALILLSCNYLQTRYRPGIPTAIFHGIRYECLDLPQTPEGGGPVHLATVDLTADGVELYLTPVDPAAAAGGYAYRTAWIGNLVQRERLAVAVNAAFFERLEGGWPRSGEPARIFAALIANHQASQYPAGQALLWFDDELTPHVEQRRPPPDDVIRQAKWGIGIIGGVFLMLDEGQISPVADHTPDCRTMLGIDPERRRLWLAVFESASQYFAAKSLAEQGATSALMLDGGASSTMAIGPGASGVRPGVVLRTWRASPTYFGVRARRLNSLEKPRPLAAHEKPACAPGSVRAPGGWLSVRTLPRAK